MRHTYYSDTPRGTYVLDSFTDALIRLEYTYAANAVEAIAVEANKSDDVGMLMLCVKRLMVLYNKQEFFFVKFYGRRYIRTYRTYN